MDDPLTRIADVRVLFVTRCGWMVADRETDDVFWIYTARHIDYLPQPEDEITVELQNIDGDEYVMSC